MILFESQRLCFRVWTPEDVDAGLAIWGDTEVMQYIEPPLSRSEVLQSIGLGRQHFERFGVQHWATCLKSTQEVVGACGFARYEQGDNLEIVFHFRKAVWGQGLATEAGQAAIRYVQRWSQAPRLVGSAHLENTASQKVLQKLGFEFQKEQWYADTQCFEAYYERPLHGSD